VKESYCLVSLTASIDSIELAIRQSHADLRQSP
jgi:hypothetical protein